MIFFSFIESDPLNIANMTLGLKDIERRIEALSGSLNREIRETELYMAIGALRRIVEENGSLTRDWTNYITENMAKIDSLFGPSALEDLKNSDFVRFGTELKVKMSALIETLRGHVNHHLDSNLVQKAWQAMIEVIFEFKKDKAAAKQEIIDQNGYTPPGPPDEELKEFNQTFEEIQDINRNTEAFLITQTLPGAQKDPEKALDLFGDLQEVMSKLGDKFHTYSSYPAALSMPYLEETQKSVRLMKDLERYIDLEA